jgi:hypothetical protein
MKKIMWMVMVSMLPVPPAVAGDFTLSGGLDFSSGQYGATQSTEIWYAPLNAKYESGASTIKLTVPYVRITAPGGGAIIDGELISVGAGASSSQEGLGDVVVSYSHALFAQPVRGMLLDVTAKAKLATADTAKGLGTGENDYSLLTDLYYLAGAWTPFATVSYRFTGDPAGSDLKNVWGGTLGLGYKQSTSDSLGLMWDSRQASTATGVASNEATAYWVHKFGGGLKLQTYAVKGFSDGSADWGLGAILSKTFEGR